MTTPLELDAYLERIGWNAPADVTYDTLAAVLEKHMSSIPFENLDVLLGRPIRVDLEGVQAKLVGARRGGYCFEHATLLGAALEALGFRPKRHAARVTMLVPRTDAPRTHMFLTVPIGDMTFVVDPGFGSLASRVPVPVIDGSATRPGDAMHWMLRDDRYWILRAQVGASPVDAWASTMEQENAVDFVMGSHFTATFPASPFVNRIMMRALTADGRVTVMNRDVTVWRGNESQTTQLANRADLRTLLVDYFGFDLPEVLQLRVSSIPEWQ